MFFDEVPARNAAFRRTRPPQPLPAADPRHLAILACYDPRLDELLRPCLGLAMGEAILIRSAGAAVTPTGDPIRSLALAVFLFDVREVLVLGHTSCRMAQFETHGFIDAFRSRAVPREAFGDGDLRTWAGALADPAEGVRRSVAVLRAAPFLPRDLAISGWLLDDHTGEVRTIVRPDEVVHGVEAGATAPTGHGPVASAPAPAEAGTHFEDPAHPVAPSHLEPPAHPVAAPGIQLSEAPRSPAVKGPRSTPPRPPPSPRPQAQDRIARAADAVNAFVRTAQYTTAWRGTLLQLRTDLAAHTDPLVRLQLLEAFLRRAAADSRDVTEAFHTLRSAALAGHREAYEALFGALLAVPPPEAPR